MGEIYFFYIPLHSKRLVLRQPILINLINTGFILAAMGSCTFKVVLWNEIISLKLRELSVKTAYFTNHISSSNLGGVANVGGFLRHFRSNLKKDKAGSIFEVQPWNFAKLDTLEMLK